MFLEDLLLRVRRHYETEGCPYEWNDVVALAMEDPRYFSLALGKASKAKYVKANNGRPTPVLWIACNMVTAKMKAPWCYYCGRTLKEGEFFSGTVHLEHFLPRGSEGPHQPMNIVHSCSKCDRLKGSLTPDQIAALWAEELRAQDVRPESTVQEAAQLDDFVDIVAPRVLGWAAYLARHHIEPNRARAFWEERRRDFRRRWHWD